ncbi:4a-hydroxytetrahydrobiopterin dehydratase [Streptomyces sp. ST2-7A]|uniref:4a-hydroxytetrahydrobiopterin dehydratase n=1 Tax=Streptomyces sp. ST2-7A TaxID=2907214 RepID=UPI001F32E564|nr:4a-hydroxytetrahydrobiopterin dehydratase [Streptomyces sp. ST2-7A]MCE7080491.1 4a-hydroxytetrahydrobiopterin dehydratase [Streptomyces sp. ST2-7A]
MSATPLTDAEISQALAPLAGWRADGSTLRATYTIGRNDLPGFYASLAAAEDAADHHARVAMLYTTVDLELNTHDAGGAITHRDTDLAGRIVELAEEHGATPAGDKG